ncbi:FAD-binding oxidoreductase [Leucobacter weissii]|uniref:FAD-binding oxidoreductase n=1 Tax=Leucobacter weissii TaxID=1983706 RepID=A0A939MMP8_9MICO|nr:FAD-binding oxidoreductase [Leucobacter weissii]MBO1902700.1 FAD-binding oxidoreductase [Leucobacter weissii]
MSRTTPAFIPAVRTAADSDEVRAALREIAAAIGEDRVILGDGGGEYRDPYQPEGWEAFETAGVVQPDRTEDVQAIVRIAAAHGVPVWAQGQGRNNGYGGAAPRVSGGITVNFRRMNRVLEIDEELGYAVVEPGVSFAELYDAVEAAGADLMVSVPDLGWGSMGGNQQDNGLTYLPYGKDWRNICGLEVVTADGGLLRTGMGAMEGNDSWHLYRRSLGPTIEPLFFQGSFGIVTRLGVWLMPKPEAITHVHIDVTRDEDLIPLVDTLRRLRLDGTIDGVPCILNTLLIASTIAPRSHWYEPEEGVIPDRVIDEIAERIGVGRWHLRLALYGDRPVNEHNLAKIERAFGGIPDARIRSTTTGPDEWADLPDPSDRVYAGVPNQDWTTMSGWRGGTHGGHMSFTPVAPLTGRQTYELQMWLKSQFERNGIDHTADLIVVNERSLCSVAGITFDVDDAAATAEAYRVMQELVREAGRIGYGEYRAHLHFMDLAQEQFGYGDHAYRRFVEKIKDAVDPQGILSPGRHGIWPAALRGER